MSFPGEQFRVHIRPGALRFIRTLNRHRVAYAVWTAATEEYATAVVANLKKLVPFHPRFVWSRAHTTNLIKDMRKVHSLTGYRNAVLLDDSPSHLSLSSNHGCVQLVAPFDVESGETDDALHRIGALIARAHPHPRFDPP